ncbi:hypothetical protein PSTG_18346, partial [Puccinia striiformis f. sp. tritici PST-78]
LVHTTVSTPNPTLRQNHDDFRQLRSRLGRHSGHRDHLISRGPNSQLSFRFHTMPISCSWQTCLLRMYWPGVLMKPRNAQQFNIGSSYMINKSAQNQHTSPTIDGSLRSKSKQCLN